jgi:hypothetical protein
VLAAAAIAVLHGGIVLFMLTGSLLALRWPRVLWLHAPVALAILGVYLTGSDCPLTSWELRLRQLAGAPGYRGGFVGHYVTEPLGFPIQATATQVGIYLVAFLANLIGYGLLVRRGFRGRSGRRPATAPPDRPAQASRRSPSPPPRQPPPAPGRSPDVPASRR